MNRHDLAVSIAKKTKLSSKEAEKLVIAFGDVVSDALSLGEKIIYSNFGTFYTVHYPSKVILHPILGAKKKMIMLPTDAVKWMPADNIKDMVDTGKSVESATSFGASKKFQEFKKEAGLPKYRSEEIEVEEDPIEIPIRKSSSKKTSAEDVAIHNPEVADAAPDAEYHTSSSKLTLDSAEPEKTAEPLPPTPAEKADSPVADEKTDEKVKVKNSGFWDHIFKKTEEADQPETGDPAPEALLKDKKAASTTKDNTSTIGMGIFGDKNDDSVKNLPETTRPAEEETKNTEDAAEDNNEKIAGTNTEPKDADFDQSITRKANVAFLDLSNTTVPKEVLAKIPEKIAREYKIAPIEENETELVVGMVDPEDIEAIEIVKKIVQKKVSPRLVTESDISHILDQYQGLESEVKEAIEDVDLEMKTEINNAKEVTNITTDPAPAARIVASLLKRAIRDHASDIHIEPGESEVIVRFRIDGVLHKKVTLPKAIQNAVVSRVKILSNLKIDEQRLPQDGRFSVKSDERQVDFRVSTMPVANGEKVVMRVLDKVSGVMSLEKLNFRKRDFDIINKNCEKSHGMILVTGPTGSGKTTTLYALISKIYTEGINVITLEDPIEYRIAGINQSQVNPDIKYTFASGLRSILRQDPDVVMIGEIRDNETAEMAVHAALTGHVVLSTLHTNDSAGAIPRLLDMEIEPFLLNSSLNLVIAQRLARKICDSCKEKVVIKSDDLKDIKADLDSLPGNVKKDLKEPFTFFHGKGCKNCDETGYKGRIGLYEVLEVSPAIRDLVGKKAAGSEIRKSAVSEGMTTMIQDGIIKALDGLTTIEEVLRVTKE